MTNRLSEVVSTRPGGRQVLGLQQVVVIIEDAQLETRGASVDDKQVHDAYSLQTQSVISGGSSPCTRV